MKRLIEILLISILLFSLAFFAGCKDEAEANEPNEIIVLKGMRHAWQEEGWNRIDYEPKPYKPKETYTAEELDEIYKDEPALGRLAKDLWGVGEGRIKIIEPNEPEITHTTLEIPDPNDDIWIDYDPYPTTMTLPRYTFEGMDFKEEITLKLGGGSEIVCNVTERLFWARMYGALSGKAPTEEVTLRFKPEPNEPNEPITSIHISMISDDFEEFNKIYIGTDSEIKEALLKDGVIAKPNEPDEIATKIYEGQKFRYKDRLYIFDSERFILIENETTTEPNEPEEGSIIVENDKGDYVFIKPKSNQFGIPTWPDYIELDKDLIYFVPDDNDEWTIGDGVEVILIHKGTRIYFKEDE